MKGIILAGGRGTRLYPMTKAVSKHLLPIYDKPMIYYPLSTLLLAGIKDILIISSREDADNYKKLFGDGSELGISVSYASQDEPRGIAEAFIIGKEFIGSDSVCLILGDNIFYGQDFSEILWGSMRDLKGAKIFGYPVNDPSGFGVVSYDSKGNVVSLEEKPERPKSNYAVPGLYFYDNSVVELAGKVKPSARGELEITDLNRMYLEKGELKLTLLSRGMTWFDAGTPYGILKAGEFVEMIQSRQGFYVSSVEEIAWRRGFITAEQLAVLGEKLSMTAYGKYLISLAREEL